MSQVGHADSKMTMDFYAQLQRRAQRDRGAKFDKLVRDARKQLQADHERRREASIGTANGTEGRKRPPKRAGRRRTTSANPPICRQSPSGRSRIRTWDLFLIREAL